MCLEHLFNLVRTIDDPMKTILIHHISIFLFWKLEGTRREILKERGCTYRDDSTKVVWRETKRDEGSVSASRTACEWLQTLPECDFSRKMIFWQLIFFCNDAGSWCWDVSWLAAILTIFLHIFFTSSIVSIGIRTMLSSMKSVLTKNATLLQWEVFSYP